MIKTFLVFVLDLLKVCLSVKLESSVLQELLCKSAWLDRSRIRLDRSKVVQIVFFVEFPTQPKPFIVWGFMFCLKYKRENPSHVFRWLFMLCVWIFCEIQRCLPSHTLRVSNLKIDVESLVINSVVDSRA